jgi:multiple sugar transport system substrate-binding protein
MALSGIYQEQRMAKAESAFFLKGEWMVVPFPQFEHAVSHVSACTYAHYLMVGAGAPEATREAAWTFIGFLLRHSEEYLAETGLLMPTKLMLDSPSLEVVPYHQVFIDDMQTSKPAYSGPVSSAMQDLIARAVERVMLEGVEPAKAYQTLKSAAQELLDEGSR